MSILPSQRHPGDLDIKDVPLFVTMGFDDNGHSGLVDPDLCEGVRWASEFFSSIKNRDGSTGACTFYQTTSYMTGDGDEPGDLVTKSWRQAAEAGHEIGCHTHTHPHGGSLSHQDWRDEIDRCLNHLTEGLEISRENIVGFRTPFLEYTAKTFDVIKEFGFSYDCSIEEGFDPDQDGRNFFWPYRLDGGSPGNRYSASIGDAHLVEACEGVWEMPSYALIAPPDDLCEKYGVESGFRRELHNRCSWFDPEDGKITGLDYNCLVPLAMSKSEFLATLKYSFDLRLEGNRAPFMLGAHSDVYATGYDICPNITIAQRREAIEEFFDYALGFKDVRVVSVSAILDWIKSQTP